MHSFTNPGADAHNIPGIKYDQKADERSWDAMKKLFRSTIGGQLAMTEVQTVGC
jgi:hypothetical protein